MDSFLYCEGHPGFASQFFWTTASESLLCLHLAYLDTLVLRIKILIQNRFSVLEILRSPRILKVIQLCHNFKVSLNK